MNEHAHKHENGKKPKVPRKAKGFSGESEKPRRKPDRVDEASDESFPASDPPSNSGTDRIGPPNKQDGGKQDRGKQDRDKKADQ